MNGRVDIARAALVVAVVFACAGCVTRTVTVTASGPASTGGTSTAAAGSIVPATPSSTGITLSGTCTAGFVTLDGSGGQPASFTPFNNSGSYPTGTPLYGGYQVTLTNTSNVTAAVKGFAVVFYDGGTELGSDGAGRDQAEFITPGHSFTWDEQTSVMTVGGEGATDTSATCALVQWFQPSATS